ncbi:MAG TPA: ABC transporter substrate-binding protein [Kineosporiaceae bacterium]|nr:ABC transporter substrate-binding protein [Kineosporiaceae bacterium]
MTRRWTIGRHGRGRAGTAAAAVAVAAALTLAGCGGAKIDSAGSSSAAPAGSGSAAACGTVNLAVNPWVGYEADAAVYAYVAKTKLGCNVVKKDLKEEVSWQGFGTGEVDLILENWGHTDLVKKYITDQKVAVDLGQTGNKGIIGWYVPPWLAKAHPDVLDAKNLNKYAAQFKTSESGGKGQLLDGDPSYVTNDAALVKNLGLDFSVVQGGSETALIQSFRAAEAQKKWFLAYFYEPQWFFNELNLVRVKLPPYTAGCDAVPAKVACDYPPYDLNKVASVKFTNGGSPAASLAKKFQWTNEDQNSVSRSIAVDKLSTDNAAKKWVDANPAKVAAWLAG